METARPRAVCGGFLPAISKSVIICLECSVSSLPAQQTAGLHGIFPQLKEGLPGLILGRPEDIDEPSMNDPKEIEAWAEFVEKLRPLEQLALIGLVNI